MSLSDYLQRNRGSSLAGTMRTPEERAKSFFSPGGPAAIREAVKLTPAEQYSLGQYEPFRGPEEPITTVMPRGYMAKGRQAWEEKEQEAGEFGAMLLHKVSEPIKGFMEFIGNLDRPQQFIFASALKALEGGGLSESVASGWGAAMHRSPEPGDQNRRIEPGEIINAIGVRFFDTENIRDKMNPVGRFVLENAMLFGVDPLILVPNAWIAKGAGRIKKFYAIAKRTADAQHAITLGTDIRAAAHVITNNEIRKVLDDIGKTDGFFGEVATWLAENVADYEIPKVHEYVSDFMTGLGVDNAVSQRIQLLLSTGQLDEKTAAKIYEGAARAAYDSADVEHVARAISRHIGKMRGVGDIDIQYLRRVKVSGRTKDGFETVTIMDGPREFLTGQMVNKLGFMPTEAAMPEAIKGMRKLLTGESAEGLMSGAIREINKRGPEEFAGIWNALDESVRREALDAGRHLTPTGKISSARLPADELARTLITDEQSAKIIQRQLNRGERNKIIEAALKRGQYTPETMEAMQRAVPIEKFTEKVWARAAMEDIPQNSSAAFAAARARAWRTGPFVVDAAAAQALRTRFLKANINLEAAHELAEYVGGYRKLEHISDIPEMLAQPGVMTTMLESNEWNAKQWHMLTGLLDPEKVLPRPIWARLKIAEDYMIGESNFLSKQLEKIATVGGKRIKEGSELDELIGKALNGKQDAIQALKNWDETGDEAFQVYGAFRAYYDGMLDRLAKSGIGNFDDLIKLKESGKVVSIGKYFPRIYQGLQEGMENAVKIGAISPEDAQSYLAAIAKRGKEDWHAMIGPMELDFVDAKHVNFSHMLKRTLPAEVAEKFQKFSAIKATRAYTHGALRKIHIEKAIQETSEAIKNAGGTAHALSESQKRYVNNLFKRLIGIESNQERVLNDTFTAIGDFFGIKLPARPATKASMFITKRFYDGLLGGNIGFFMKNLSQGINTSTKTGIMNTMRGVTMMADDTFRSTREARNLLGQFYQLFETGKLYGHGLWGGLKRFMYLPAHVSENINRGIAFNAGFAQRMREMQKSLRAAGKIGKKENLTHTMLAEQFPDLFREAVQYGHSIANETQFIYGVLGRSPLAGTPLGRLGLQFFSWPIKQTQFLLEGSVKDKSWGFAFNYLLMTGMFSKIAEHSHVDAGDFMGFGFFPSQPSPTFQAFQHLGSAIDATREGDQEKASEHMKNLAMQIEYMIPCFLQFEKWGKALEEWETGEKRGYRGRMVRQVGKEGALSELIEGANPVLRDLGLPELTGENVVRLLGLPTTETRDHREAQKEARIAEYRSDRKAARYVDEYLKHTDNGDYIEAEKVLMRAHADGVPISSQMIAREREAKRTPTLTRIEESARLSVRDEIEEIYERRNIPVSRRRPGVVLLPPDPLGGTGSTTGGGIRP